MEKQKKEQHEGSSPPKKKKQKAGILNDLPMTWFDDDEQGESNMDATIQRGWMQLEIQSFNALWMEQIQVRLVVINFFQ
jgi:hypothetical protein